jgi:hypothetical protein
MKRLWLLTAMFCALTAPAFAQADGAEPQLAPADVRRDVAPEPKQAQRLQQQITDLYISDFKNEVGLTDEQFLKLNNPLREFMRRRFMAPRQRQDLNQRLQRLLSQPNPSDSDVQQLTNEIAEHDREIGTLEARFLARMGSELTPRQRLLFTQFNQKFFNEKLPGLISQARERIAGEQPQGQRQRPGLRGQNPNRPNVQARPQADRPALRPKANATR